MTTTYPSAEWLLAEAASQAGSSDFGPGDFRVGLEVLLDSLARDGDLSASAAEGTVGDLRRRLVNRLEVEAWYGTHPEVGQLTVQGPVDINGLPRTGTTALAHMLSLDPQFRCLRQWEQMKPCPPPLTETEVTDGRRVAWAKQIEAYNAVIKEKHIFDLDSTGEDTELLGMAFHGQQFTLPVWSYQEWWRAADMSETYEYHRRVTTLLQSRRPPNLWLFKAPHHNFHLEAIVAAYPDVRFVMTHRDPVKSVPSWASIVASILPEPAGERDVHRLGREAAKHLRVGVTQAMAARARIGEDRFFDVYHRQMIKDPMGTVHGLYDWLGYELTPDVERAIAGWQESNRSGAHGTHRYTAREYGLTDAQLRSDFAEYVRHFDVETEVDV
jgi:hypothetical protein